MALSTTTTVISNYLSSEYNLVKQISSLAYKDESDISSHYLPSNALCGLSGNWQATYETVSCLSGSWNTAHSRVSALSHDISGDIGSIGYKNNLELSDVNSLNEELDNKALSVHTHITNDITNISDYVAKNDNLSVINDNEISNYVYIQDPNINIGYKSSTTGIYGLAIGSYSSAEKRHAIAVGTQSHAKEEGAVQIGVGDNCLSNSLQFLSTVVVDSSGNIPNSSLELKSVNGILSSDGNGNIVSADVKAVSIKDETKEDAEWKKSDLSILKLPLSSYELSVIGGTISDNVLYITDSDYMDMYRCQICALTMPEEDGQVYEGVAATKTYVDSKIKEVKDKIVETTSEILNNILNKQMDEISIENIAEALSVLCKKLKELN